MLLRRAARFLDPDTIWQQLEEQMPEHEDGGLVEHPVGNYNAGSLYLGIVQVTGERAVWLKVTGVQPSLPAGLPDALWVKKITYPGYAVFTVVLTDPGAQEAFSGFVRELLADVEQADAGVRIADLLVFRLQQWWPMALPGIAA
ncbi:hypothetical protein Q5H93_08270 [Hymenobacter sp. ASUV-10]|uniref:Uncharacterized protein n=1 Tax=Hymenobacter aranciens TaxID=3063996 RepID=A0ABT9B8Y5_9BACT|nr:hypothetical protein [Hymenobacter sp. ASUV-10]MDO7874725.1 hypothetical protein [Hymenobacter sp. ASUV-10]